MLRVPPLRERPEDIPLLCSDFVEKFARRHRSRCAGISPAAYHLLIRIRWPGNVRELENAMERAVLVASAPRSSRRTCPSRCATRRPTTRFSVPPHRTLAEIERLAILQTLERTNWNKQEAAQILGLYRPTLYSKMRRHGIRDPRASAAWLTKCDRASAPPAAGAGRLARGWASSTTARGSRTPPRLPSTRCCRCFRSCC